MSGRVSKSECEDLGKAAAVTDELQDVSQPFSWILRWRSFFCPPDSAGEGEAEPACMCARVWVWVRGPTLYFEWVRVSAQASGDVFCTTGMMRGHITSRHRRLQGFVLHVCSSEASKPPELSCVCPLSSLVWGILRCLAKAPVSLYAAREQKNKAVQTRLLEFFSVSISFARKTEQLSFMGNNGTPGHTDKDGSSAL